MTIIEALSVGLPILATPVGGIPEAVQDGVNGRLIPRNVEALTKSILRLYNDPAEQARLGTESRRVFCEKFEISKMVELYDAVSTRAVIMSWEKLAILIPTGNRPGILATTLVELRKIGMGEVALWVYDDASDDGEAIRKVVQKTWPGGQVVRGENRVGQAEGRNASCAPVGRNAVCFWMTIPFLPVQTD